MADNKAFIVQTKPFRVPTNGGKVIKEHFGLAAKDNSQLSMAHLIAPPGWSEPFQTPNFDEYMFIIKGKKQFVINGETIVLKAGQSIKVCKGTRVQYANPFSKPCEYIAICVPAFSLQNANRETE